MALPEIRYYRNKVSLNYISDIEYITHISSNDTSAKHCFVGKIYINKK